MLSWNRIDGVYRSKCGRFTIERRLHPRRRSASWWWTLDSTKPHGGRLPPETRLSDAKATADWIATAEAARAAGRRISDLPIEIPVPRRRCRVF